MNTHDTGYGWMDGAPIIDRVNRSSVEQHMHAWSPLPFANRVACTQQHLMSLANGTSEHPSAMDKGHSGKGPAFCSQPRPESAPPALLACVLCCATCLQS